MSLNGFKWAAARLLFHAYVSLCFWTVVGPLLTVPVMSRLFFQDWRFWRYWKYCWSLYAQGWKVLLPILRGENNGFMFSVPLASPPVTVPDRLLVRLRDDWAQGSSCDMCSRCCEKVKCPMLDRRTGLCLSYDSFFWRYFNCGRYPTARPEIDYYGCPKWAMRPQPAAAGGLAPADQPYPIASGEEPLTE